MQDEFSFLCVYSFDKSVSKYSSKNKWKKALIHYDKSNVSELLAKTEVSCYSSRRSRLSVGCSLDLWHVTFADASLLY